jgi:hypothetical protein
MLRKLLRSYVPLMALGPLIAAAPAGASPEKVGPPTSVTALGDSLTRGYNSQGSGCTAFADYPTFSWATGSNAAVNSYYNRVKALNPSVAHCPTRRQATTRSPAPKCQRSLNRRRKRSKATPTSC